MDRNIYSDMCIASIRKHLNNNDHQYITYPKFIFLCGKGFNSTEEYKLSNRGIIDSFIKKLLPDTHIVLSEQMWEDRFDNSIDLLIFEEFLAEVSDSIILFVESPGSFCELGAFSYADTLFSDKLIIIMDKKYRGSKSFITTGPALKAKKDGSKIVYAEIENRAVLSSSELRTEILDMAQTFKSKRSGLNKRVVNSDQDHVYISSFLVEILEIIRLVQPISDQDLLQLYKEIKQFDGFTLVKRDGNRFKREIEFSYILKLLQTAKIIEIDSSIIKFPDYEKAQHLMFKYSGRGIERERNKIICRKYKYGGYI